MSATIRASETTPGKLYRTPKGHVVKVLEHSGHHKVCVGYSGVYGLGWRTIWIPAETELVPANDLDENTNRSS